MSAPHLVESAQALVALLAGRPVADLDDAALFAVMDAMGAHRASLDSIAAQVAAEAAERCLHVREAERSPADLVGKRMGVEKREAFALRQVGEAIAPRIALTGEVLEPEHPAVAEAFAAGSISLGVATCILDALRRIDPLVGRAQRDEIERALVTRAPGLSRRDLILLARRVLDLVDPDGAEPREDLLRARSGVQVTRTADGLVKWILTMHPEAAGFLTAAVDARTAPRRQPRFGDDVDLALDDTRTLAQKRLDALTDIARESLARDDGQLAGAPVTMIVKVSLDELRSGVGTAWIAGFEEPISIATARRLACDAEILPAVLGGDPEPLDLGRSERLFSAAQRRALVVRDGGCVWPGCNAPPGWCEVAHLRSWLDGGPTDLQNGVLLCPYHHRRLDHDGWVLRWQGSVLELIPPKHVDPSQHPRRAGPVPELVLA